MPTDPNVGQVDFVQQLCQQPLLVPYDEKTIATFYSTLQQLCPLFMKRASLLVISSLLARMARNRDPHTKALILEPAFIYDLVKMEAVTVEATVLSPSPAKYSGWEDASVCRAVLSAAECKYDSDESWKADKAASLAWLDAIIDEGAGQ